MKNTFIPITLKSTVTPTGRMYYGPIYGWKRGLKLFVLDRKTKYRITEYKLFVLIIVT